MIKIVGIIFGALVLGAGVAAAIVMGIIPVPFGPLAEARALAEKAKPPVTVMYPRWSARYRAEHPATCSSLMARSCSSQI